MHGRYAETSKGLIVHRAYGPRSNVNLNLTTDPESRMAFSDKYVVDKINYFRGPGLVEPLLGYAVRAFSSQRWVFWQNTAGLCALLRTTY